MTNAPSKPRLAAILAADVAGYTQLMERDTDGTVAAWQAARDDIIEPALKAHSGRLVKLTGDGFLAEFPSAQEAVRCALTMQENLAANPLGFRMGVNLGDIVDDGQDIHGEGVNVAARLERLAEPGGVCLSGEVHALVRNRIDFPFADLGLHTVKHVSQPVRVFSSTTASAMLPEAASPASPASTWPSSGPAIAVLPFDNMSGDSEQEFFADGICEDPITTLSQIGNLTVASRNSAFALKKRGASAQDAGRDLNVRFVLTGSVRKAGSRIRITVQLTDTDTETNLWAARYDRDSEDIFAVQDEITLTIATALQVELTEGEQAKLRYTSTSNIAAWTAFMRGVSFFRTVSAETYRQARACFEEALQADPDSAQIHAMLACTHAIEGRFYWTKDRNRTLQAAKECADRALALDPDNADAWGALGYWHMCETRLDKSVEAYACAVELAPGHADLHALFALALTFANRPTEAVREAETAMRLNPLDPGWYYGVLGHALRYAGRHDDALAVLLEYNRQSPGFGLVDIVLTHADTGNDAGAARAAAELLAARPEFTVSNWERTQNSSNAERIVRDRSALLAAGLPN